MDRSPPVSIPRLHTARLTLREYRVADFDGFAANFADPKTTEFIGALDRLAAWRAFACHTGNWLLRDAGWWMVEAQDTGKVVGTVGAFFRDGWPEIEIGWNTYRAFWGRGFATEAASEAVRYAFEVRGERRVTALIDPSNKVSIRVAARLGMTHDADTELGGKPVGRYARAQTLTSQSA